MPDDLLAKWDHLTGLSNEPGHDPGSTRIPRLWKGVIAMSNDAKAELPKRGQLRASVIAVLESDPGRNFTVKQVAKTLNHQHGSVQSTLSDCHLTPHIPVKRVARSTYRFIRPDLSTKETLVAKVDRIERVTEKSASACHLEVGDLLQVIWLEGGKVLAIDGNHNLLNLSFKVLANLRSSI